MHDTIGCIGVRSRSSNFHNANATPVLEVSREWYPRHQSTLPPTTGDIYLKADEDDSDNASDDDGDVEDARTERLHATGG